MDDRKTRAQLIEKVRALRQRVAELEESKAQLKKEVAGRLAKEVQIDEVIPKSGFSLERDQRLLRQSRSSS